MKRRFCLKKSRSLLALVSLLVGCTDGTGDRGVRPEPQLVLGFSQIVGEANWNIANTESIRNAAHDAGIDLQLVDARRSQETQVAALRSFVKQHVDVIAFSPVVETGWEFVLREIRSAGIPVILMDRTIEITDESLYVSLIGSDFVEEGRRAGRYRIIRSESGDFDRARARSAVHCWGRRSWTW
ncbi:MAG TPA: substrate-binding domain-containing protein [Steroidobacteraceae bacterium]|nr:substrate-binding domain-containing protein [Steroidobacteraceae bacterium]